MNVSQRKCYDAKYPSLMTLVAISTFYSRETPASQSLLDNEWFTEEQWEF